MAVLAVADVNARKPSREVANVSVLGGAKHRDDGRPLDHHDERRRPRIGAVWQYCVERLTAFYS